MTSVKTHIVVHPVLIQMGFQMPEQFGSSKLIRMGHKAFSVGWKFG